MKSTIITMMLVAVMLLSGSFASAQAAQVAVKKGDSLWKISKNLHVPYGEVVKLNKKRFKNINFIRVGQQVLIPDEYVIPAKVKVAEKSVFDTGSEKKVSRIGSTMAAPKLSTGSGKETIAPAYSVASDKKTKQWKILNSALLFLGDSKNQITGVTLIETFLLSFLLMNWLVGIAEGKSKENVSEIEPSGLKVISKITLPSPPQADCSQNTMDEVRKDTRGVVEKRVKMGFAFNWIEKVFLSMDFIALAIVRFPGFIQSKFRKKAQSRRFVTYKGKGFSYISRENEKNFCDCRNLDELISSIFFIEGKRLPDGLFEIPGIFKDKYKTVSMDEQEKITARYWELIMENNSEYAEKLQFTAAE